MADGRPEAKKPQTLTDDHIVTERKIARRAFLGSTGVYLAGGAMAIVASARAAAQDAAPQQSDPDKAKQSDPDKKRKTKSNAKASDPDKAKAADPDKEKAAPPQ
jgi:hypothetical protein